MRCQGPAEAGTWAPGLPCSSRTGCHVDTVLVPVLALSTTGCGFCVPLTSPSARDSGLPKAVVTSRTHPSVGPRAPATVVLWGQCVCAVCPCWWEADLKRAQRKPLSSSFGSPYSCADSRALPATFPRHVPKGCTQTLLRSRALPGPAPAASDLRPLPSQALTSPASASCSRSVASRPCRPRGARPQFPGKLSVRPRPQPEGLHCELRLPGRLACVLSAPPLPAPSPSVVVETALK